MAGVPPSRFDDDRGPHPAHGGPWLGDAGKGRFRPSRWKILGSQGSPCFSRGSRGVNLGSAARGGVRPGGRGPGHRPDAGSLPASGKGRAWQRGPGFCGAGAHDPVQSVELDPGSRWYAAAACRPSRREGD